MNLKRGLVVVLLSFLSVLITYGQSTGAQHTPQPGVQAKIRTITAFIRLERQTYRSQVADALSLLKAAKTEFTKAGYQVETLRITTQPFPESTLGQKTKDFPLFVRESRFTDDTVLTLAVADCLLTGSAYVDKFHEYSRAYPDRCYGVRFWHWVESGSRLPYNSWGNGAAMRVSPVAFAFPTLEEVLKEAKASADVTHNHPEGVRGAQATAAAIFLARQGESKRKIRGAIEKQFGYDLSRTIASIRAAYSFDESCQGTVPEAITAFLDSEDYEDAVRLAVSLGGDADTLACITGGIAGAFYGGVPSGIAAHALALLDDRLRETLARFCETYGIRTL
jgi:ADP-ribosylglycohydrolase